METTMSGVSGERIEAPLLEARNLTTHFHTGRGLFRAVDGVSFTVDRGRTVGLVGESGCGKSVTSLSVMGLVPSPPGRVKADAVLFDGRDILRLPAADRRRMRGSQMSMIFQEPMTSLNPVHTVGQQIVEGLLAHERLSAKSARERAMEMLELVRIPSAADRLDDFPHRMSGGQRQRVMIAMAIACNPKLLIADEPTTALDVTIQAQVLQLLLRLQRERGMALLLITHDLAVVAETAHRVYVMYAGQVVETGPVPQIFDAPLHPYTQALLAALPEHNVGMKRLKAISGVVPGAHDRPQGCLLNPRCEYAVERCRIERPALEGERRRQSRCHFPLDAAGRPTRGWHRAAPTPATEP